MPSFDVERLNRAFDKFKQDKANGSVLLASAVTKPDMTKPDVTSQHEINLGVLTVAAGELAR